METIKGLIEALNIKNGTDKNGNLYKAFVFTIGGKNYSTFDDKIGTVFKVGQFVEMTGQQNGKYFNMKSMSEAQVDERKEMKELNLGVVEDLLRQILAELKNAHKS